MVVGEQGPLDRDPECTVAPDHRGQGQQPLRDPDPHPLDGVGAVALQAELVFEGVRLTVCREAPQGTGVASSSRHCSHHDGQATAKARRMAATSGAARRSRRL
jgi:hypothetical protein